MKLSYLNYERTNRNLRIKEVIEEGYGRTYEFDYHGKQVTDPRPNVLSLGRWTSPRGNPLMAGINLNYLTNDQVTRLQQGLQPILKSRNLKKRVGTLRSAFPDIFDTAYRTYNRSSINVVDPGTLRFMAKPTITSPDEDPTPERPDEKPRFMDTPRRIGGDLADKISKRHEVDKPEPEKEEPEVEKPEPKPEVAGDMVGTDEIEPEAPTTPEPEETEEEEVETDEEET
jgi:hypothetical protein